MKKRKIIVAISGASGATLGLKLLEAIAQDPTIEAHFVASQHADVVLQKEQQTHITYNNSDIAAAIASGSFQAEAMIIAPCSMNTLAKISVGIADNLITRAAAVMLKERKKLILAPREMPFSTIALENMQKLSSCGVIIAPPVMAYYSQQQTLQDMENFLIGKWLDLLTIQHNLYKRWH